MKDSFGPLLIILCLSGFAWWQVSDSAKKDAKIEAQADRIEHLIRQAGRIDEAMGQWRRENERIANERQAKRTDTREAARRDPTLKEQLETPLHPALLPMHNGGAGLLGKPGTGAHPVGPSRADPAP